MNQPKSRLAPAMIVAGILSAVLLALYVVGYFVCSDIPWGTEEARGRAFNTKWQATIYRPAAWLESKAIGKQVKTTSYENP